MSENIVESLTEIFHTVFNDDSIEITNELSAKDVNNWDSMNHVNLIIAVETEFGIRFSNDEISDLQNVGELIQLIQKKIDGA